VQKNPTTYEHIDPALVGNAQRVLVSDLSGARTSSTRRRSSASTSRATTPAVTALLQELKELEARGFAFEGAEASFELLMQKALERRPGRGTSA
jgi:2-isopropylmalate synthase